MLLGQVQELLAALAQAHAQQAAGADGNEALGNLPAVAPVPLGVEGVPPGVDAVFPVVQDALLHQDHIQGAHQAHAADAQGDQPALDAAHDHQHDARADDEDGAGQVGLPHHQKGDDAQNQHIGPDALAPGLHFFAFFGNGGGEIDDHGHFGQLRGLERGKANPDPALRAAFLRTENRNEQQKEYRACQHEKRDASPELIVDARDEQHHADAQHRENRLPRKIIGGVSLFIICSCIAR